jgi:SNF2 family DNA or RNA helicase
VQQLRTPEQLHEYQKKLVNFQCSHPSTALWVDMGLGKSAATLTSIVHLLNTGFLKAVLIVAPIRVCRLVWRQESQKWSHTKHLTFNMVMGTKDQRVRALMKPANIYITNYENLQWLAETLQTYYVNKSKPLPFNGIVFDELSKTKNSSTNRVKALMKVLPHTVWRTGLTGSPASNGYKDLHGQFLVLDGGQRLGTSKTEFERRFYKKAGPYKTVALPETEDAIKNLIGDITITMSAEDYNKLPDMIVNDVEVELPDELRSKYEQMEREFFLQLDSGAEKEMFNQASLTNACLQFSNGAVYPVAGMPLWEPVHDEKLNALDDIIEECGGQQIFLAYAYRSDAARIMERFSNPKEYPGLNPINLTECKTEGALKNAMYRWSTGECRLLIAHPASAGHGVDGLQHNANTLVWFGLNWSLELYEQFNGRLRRQGQGKPVICHRILCRDTMDQAQALALNDKANNQTALRNAVKNYRLMKQSGSKSL